MKWNHKRQEHSLSHRSGLVRILAALTGALTAMAIVIGFMVSPAQGDDTWDFYKRTTSLTPSPDNFLLAQSLRIDQYKLGGSCWTKGRFSWRALDYYGNTRPGDLTNVGELIHQIDEVVVNRLKGKSIGDGRTIGTPIYSNTADYGRTWRIVKAFTPRPNGHCPDITKNGYSRRLSEDSVPDNGAAEAALILGLAFGFGSAAFLGGAWYAAAGNPPADAIKAMGCVAAGVGVAVISQVSGHSWRSSLRQALIACGGAALTAYGFKPSLRYLGNFMRLAVQACFPYDGGADLVAQDFVDEVGEVVRNRANSLP